jgi:hypothetical protein
MPLFAPRLGTGGHSKLHHMQKHGNGIDTPFKLPDADKAVLEN